MNSAVGKEIHKPILDVFNQAVTDVINDQDIQNFTLMIINHHGSLSRFINENNARVNHLILVEPWFMNKDSIEEYKEKGIPILNKATDTQYTDFLELILHNINLQDIYS
mgnify:CR=1 FL=1